MAIMTTHFVTCDECGYIGDEIASDSWVRDSTPIDPVAEGKRLGFDDIEPDGYWVCADCRL